MIRKTTWLCLLISFGSSTLFGQKKDTIVFSNFQLRQTFGTPDGAGSPAQFQLTIPDNNKWSWLVDAAVAVNVDPLSGTYGNSRIFAEYHRNTALDAPQNNYQLGFNYQYLKTNAGMSIAINSNLKYIADLTDDSHSVALTANFSPYLSHGVNLGRNGYLGHQRYGYSLTPYAEVQYQQVSGGNGLLKDGNILRPVANLSGAFSLNRHVVRDTVYKPDTVNHKLSLRRIIKVAKPEKCLEFNCGYSTRYAMVNTVSAEKFTELFKAGINYYLIDTKKLSVSLGGHYYVGSDPLYGLRQQHFWQFAFQAQI